MASQSVATEVVCIQIGSVLIAVNFINFMSLGGHVWTSFEQQGHSDKLKGYMITFVGAFACRDYQEQCPSAQEVTTIVNTYLSEKENLDNSLPRSVIIGPFSVRVEGVKQNLSRKYNALATAMLDLLAENLHARVKNVSHLV